MKRRIFVLRFRQEAGIFYPENPLLHRLACIWAQSHFTIQPNFTDYLIAWAECSVDEKGEPIEVHGVVGAQNAIDFSMMRFTDRRSAASLLARAEAWLHDQGAAGRQVLVRVGLKDEQVCPDAEEWLKEMKCEPAERFLFKVR